MRFTYMMVIGGFGGFFIGLNSPSIPLAMVGGVLWGALVGHVILTYMNEDGSLKRDE